MPFSLLPTMIVDSVTELTPAFLEDWRAYKQKLSEYMESDLEEKKEIEDRSVILTYLELLKGAMADMDIDAMDSAMEELRQYIYEDCVEKSMEQLGIAVTYLDGEKAIPLIEEIKEQIEKM